MVASKASRLQEYKAISEQFHVSFEINDFYEPSILDCEEEKNRLIQQYLEVGVPEESTMHGAFLDIVLFSSDERIAEISKLRMAQSMEIAKTLGLSAVVFHTNSNPMLEGDIYNSNVVSKSVDYMEQLLKKYPELHIYLENMFDASPDILVQISEKLSKYPNYGICLDYGHASVSETPMDVWVEALAPYLRHIHISDNDLKRDLHMTVGSGRIDWNQFTRYYHTHFEQCTVLVEVLEPEAQIQSLHYLKNNFMGLFRE